MWILGNLPAGASLFQSAPRIGASTLLRRNEIRFTISLKSSKIGAFCFMDLTEVFLFYTTDFDNLYLMFCKTIFVLSISIVL